MGVAYVTFARSHPGLFVLMFRSERLDASRPALRAAIDASRQALRAAGGASPPDKAPELAEALASDEAPRSDNAVGPEKPLAPLQLAAQAAARWSLVHGFAMLLLDGRLAGMIGSLPDGENADDLLQAVLAATRIGD